MDTADLRGLLDLLAERGTVAWVLDRPDVADTELVVDHSGLESIVSVLVSRGFTADVGGLPARVDCRHPRHGTLAIRPFTFRADGSAYGYGDDAPLRIEASAFDPVDVPLRTVRPTDGAAS